jgi:hypothetical protein
VTAGDLLSKPASCGRIKLNAPCQSYVVPGALFCAEHNGKPSALVAPVEDDMAPKSTPTPANGHRPATHPPASASAGRPALPTGERQARATVIAAMGNNPAAILVTIGILVETGSAHAV